MGMSPDILQIDSSAIAGWFYPSPLLRHAALYRVFNDPPHHNPSRHSLTHHHLNYLCFIMTIIQTIQREQAARLRFLISQELKAGDCTPEEARQWAVATLDAEIANECKPTWKGPDDRAPIFI